MDVTVSDDVAGQARVYTSDLTATIDSLLRDFVQRQRAAKDQALHRQLEEFNRFHAENGLLSDEFPLQ